jgi:hypothetical protein
MNENNVKKAGHMKAETEWRTNEMLQPHVTSREKGKIWFMDIMKYVSN